MDVATANILTSLVISIVVGIVYNAYGYLTTNNPTEWEPKRFLATVIFGFAVGVIGTIIIQMQVIDTTGLDYWTFIVGVSAAYYGGLNVVNRLMDWIWIKYMTGAAVGATVKNDGSLSFEPGFTVVPAFPGGQSPYTAVLRFQVSPTKGVHQVIDLDIDWADGNPLQSYVPDKNGMVIAGHNYTYVQEGKYTGHTFYPQFTIRTADGIVKSFNNPITGRCCAVWVYIQPPYSMPAGII